MAYLRILMGDTLLEQRELTAGRTTIGRAADNDIVLKGRGVSKYHAVIERDGDSYVFVDLDSANGSFLAGRRIGRHPLTYWDEVQVFHYVLRFMAVARARGEEAGAPASDGQRAQEETMELNIASLGDLARLKRRVNVASLMVLGHGDSARCLRLDKVHFTIGRAAGNDLAIGGWLAPRIAARIQRRNDGFYLTPGRRGRVRLNGRRIARQARLVDGDRLKVRGLALEFRLRPQDEA